MEQNQREQLKRDCSTSELGTILKGGSSESLFQKKVIPKAAKLSELMVTRYSKAFQNMIGRLYPSSSLQTLSRINKAEVNTLKSTYPKTWCIL